MFDLHFHSTHSDGKLSVAELASTVQMKAFSHCSLTDHNTVEGIRELEERLAGTPTKVIRGVELTAKYDEDEVHLLAYDFELEAMEALLKERNDLVRGQKKEEMALAIECTIREGLEITPDLFVNEKQPVTLTTALDICEKPHNQELFLRRHGKTLTPEEFFYTYQAPGKSCAVVRAGVTIEWLVDRLSGLVRDLIIAHPFVSVSVVAKALNEERIREILTRGIHGVEVYHNDTSQDQIAFLETLVRERTLKYSAGSDFHGKLKNTPLGQYALDKPLPSFRLTNFACESV